MNSCQSSTHRHDLTGLLPLCCSGHVLQFARPIRDAELPRPWSKHSDNSILKQKQQQQEQQAATELKVKAAAGKKRKAPGAVVEEDAAADPKLAEFLSLMQPRSKARMWSNDDLLPSDAPVKGGCSAHTAGCCVPGCMLFSCMLCRDASTNSHHSVCKVSARASCCYLAIAWESLLAG